MPHAVGGRLIFHGKLAADAVVAVGGMGRAVPRRVVFRRHGAPEVLEVEEVPTPRPGPGEIRIAVAYAGVNYADVLARRGFYKWAPPLPTCVGFELSGTVVEIGGADRRPSEGTFGEDLGAGGRSDLAVGDRVLAITRFGGYADEIVVEANRAVRVPDGVDLATAAALPAVYVTAWHSIREVMRARPGESILIQAVAGGVGIAALQIAKILGLETFGTASSEAKLAFAREHGLDHGIDYVTHDFERVVLEHTRGRGVDHVLDSLGGEGLRKGYRCLSRGGTVVTIGAAQVAPPRRDPIALLRAGVELVRGGVFHPFQLIEDNRGVAGVQVLLLWDDLPRLARAFDELLGWLREGRIRPHVDRVVPLASAAEAHRALEGRGTRGKLLLRAASAPPA
jgi:NADPH:quinone reductase-like Zn-dependent oxidoreductase